MHISLDKNSVLPLSQQLYQFFSDRIGSGLLKNEDKLPSIRSLSKQLGISPMTIVKAYNELEKAGLATIIQGKGVYVRQHHALNNTLSSKDDPLAWQTAIPDYLSRSQFRYNPSLSFGEVPFNLSIAALSPQLLPTRMILQDSLELLIKKPELVSHYPPVQGDLEFRKSMGDYLKTKGILTPPENILITHGAQQGISLISSTFLGPSDIVIMESPTYPGAIDLFRCSGATILTVPVDKEGMCTDLLLNLCERYSPKLIYTMPNFHNPTGYSMSTERRLQLLDIARYHDCIILEDDPWSEINYGKEKSRSLKSLDTDGHVIYLKSMSKPLGPAYRLAALVAEGSLLSRLIAAKANHDLGTSVLNQKMLVNFLSSNKIHRYIENTNQKLKTRRDRALKLLADHAPPGTKWTLPAGGISIWVTLPPQYNVEKLLLHAVTSKSISFLPGTFCYPAEPEYHHFRISFSYLDEEDLDKALLELCQLIKNQDFPSTQEYHPLV